MAKLRVCGLALLRNRVRYWIIWILPYPIATTLLLARSNGGTGTPSMAWLTGDRPRLYVALLSGRIRCGMNEDLASLHGFPSTSHWKGRLLDGPQPVPGRKTMGTPGCSGEAQRPWHDRNDSSPSHAAANSRQPLSQLHEDHRHERERNDYEETHAFH